MNVVSQERGNNAKRTASPAWGVGISYRFCIHREVMASADDIDFLEIPALDYVDAYRRKYADRGEVLLKEAVSRFPAVGHGVDISVGSADPPAPEHLARVASFAQRVPISEYSEHLTCTRAGEENVECFVAIPFTDLGVAVVYPAELRIHFAATLYFSEARTVSALPLLPSRGLFQLVTFWPKSKEAG